MHVTCSVKVYADVCIGLFNLNVGYNICDVNGVAQDIANVSCYLTG